MATPSGGRLTHDTTPRECFDSAWESFAIASARGEIEQRVRIAGETIAFRYADPTLHAELSAAFAHHPADDGEPALEVVVWESARSGAPLPRVGMGALDGGVQADTRIAGPQPIEWRYDAPRRILNVFDRATGRAAFHIADMEALPHWERSSPFRQLLAWHFRARSKHLLHAAALGNHGIGLLLVGRGGSGKSSSALACLATPVAGLGFAGDDYCVVDTAPVAMAWSLYCTAKVGWEQVGWFPRLEPFVVNRGREADDEKALYRFDRADAPALVEQVAICAVVVPTVDPGSVTAIEPLGKAEALRALAPSSLFQLAGPNGRDFHELAELVAGRPAFRLRLGGDPAAVPPVLGRLLRELLA